MNYIKYERALTKDELLDLYMRVEEIESTLKLCDFVRDADVINDLCVELKSIAETLEQHGIEVV